MSKLYDFAFNVAIALAAVAILIDQYKPLAAGLGLIGD